MDRYLVSSTSLLEVKRNGARIEDLRYSKHNMNRKDILDARGAILVCAEQPYQHQAFSHFLNRMGGGVAPLSPVNKLRTISVMEIKVASILNFNKNSRSALKRFKLLSAKFDRDSNVVCLLQYG